MNWRAMAFWVCAIAAAAAYCDAVRGDEPPAAPVDVGAGISGSGAVSGDIFLLDVGGGPAAYGYSSPGYAYGASAAYGRGRLMIAEAYAPSLPDLVATQREQLIASLQQLQDAYCRAAMLDEALAVRDQIRSLEAYRAPLPPISGRTTGAVRPDGTPVIDDGSPYALRGRDGESFFAEVTGTTTGSVWGADVYTDDSDLGTAAVHAGVLKEGETKVVKFTILPGQDSYAASSENGVSTMSYGSYGGSFRIDAAALRLVYPYTLRDQGHERLQVFVIGNPGAGTVWGTGIYTDDSALDAAAVHAGIVSEGQRAIATIELLAGKDSYEGSESYGVTSSDYGSWQASYRFLPDETISAAPLPGLGGPTAQQTPYELRGRDGETFTATVTGSTSGSVWGDGIYTDDSDLATASVHAGVLQDGETGEVSFTILPGQESYASSERNGVSTRSWHSYGGSFRIERDVKSGSEEGGGTETITVTGSTEGTVWGSGIYTSDSDVGTAAVHAGILTPGETGSVTIVRLPGQDSYTGSSSNDVTTYDYGSWSGSFRFDGDATLDAAADGQRETVTVTGSTSGTVWGSRFYTSDSDVGTAAVHAGHLQPGETGTLTIVRLPGQDSYTGSTGNGVTTYDYGPWSGSFRFDGDATLDAVAAGPRETVTVTGSTSGTVWGSGVYTSDSDMDTAAVHAGIVGEGETATVQIERLPGRDSYEGSESNGVTSHGYGSWSASFRFVGEANADTATSAPKEKLTVTGSTSGTVWGTGVYTSDSDVSTAAVHAGLLEEGQTGGVLIERLPGQESYEGSENNGVSSYSYGPWDGSFRFVGEASLIDRFRDLGR